MENRVIKKLLDLNSKFYQTFALQFSATRKRVQPGVRRIFNSLRGDETILDIGCGNGQTYCSLIESGYKGKYYGLDSNETFLQIAQNNSIQNASDHINAIFINNDIAEPGWYQNLVGNHFDLIFIFATLHHIPSKLLRQRILSEIHKLCASTADGRKTFFFHSEWQFLNNPKYLTRIVPWKSIGLNGADIEPGDYLLDWRHEGYGIRYVHHFSVDELEQLANENKFHIIDSYFSDGREGNLALYQTWMAD